NVNEKTERFGHAEMPVFGAGKYIPARVWQSVFRQLLAMGLIRVDHPAALDDVGHAIGHPDIGRQAVAAGAPGLLII
ncbi:RQC domain-containing protein, partial [Rhizobium leguminosarum]